MKTPKATSADAKFAARVDQVIGRGELSAAARMVKDADLSEVAFDDLMQDRPDLRAAFLSL